MDIQPVDKLEIKVLVDNVTDSLSSVPENVTHETVYIKKKGYIEELAGEHLCCGAHGLSLLITASKGEVKHSLLLDSGPDGDVFKRNTEKLNANLSAVEVVVLSHGHWDHAGGFLTAIDLIKSKNQGKDITFHLNDGMFYRRGVQTADGQVLPFKKIPSIEELEKKGVKVVSSDDARLLLDNYFYLSGEIPRVVEYEKGFLGHVRQLANGEWEDDHWVNDERFLAVNVKDKGLVIFPACSHAGIINVLKHAQELFPNVPLFAVMGGFHLSGLAMEKIISQTVKDMKQFDLKMIIPAHCTGWRAVKELGNTFGDKVLVPSAVGRLYSF